MKHLLFAGNGKVFDGILSCLVSVFRRTSSREAVHVWVMTMDASHLNPAYLPIDDREIAFLDRYVKTFGADNTVTKLDVTDLYRREFSGCPNEGAYCSPYTLLRLLADLVPELAALEKLLYLDCDLLFNRDIDLWWGQDLTGYEYAAARDHYGKFLIQPNYINAGVILFNMAEVKRTGLLKKARELIKTKKLVFADQSAIMRSTTKKKMLPQKFNDQKFLTKKTVVRHFSKRLFWLPYPHTENIKQWQVEKVRKKFGYPMLDDIYEEYFRYKNEFEGKNN